MAAKQLPQPGSKDSSTEGVLNAITVSLTSLTNNRNHFFSGREQGRGEREFLSGI